MRPITFTFLLLLSLSLFQKVFAFFAHHSKPMSIKNFFGVVGKKSSSPGKVTSASLASSSSSSAPPESPNKRQRTSEASITSSSSSSTSSSSSSSSSVSVSSSTSVTQFQSGWIPIETMDESWKSRLQGEASKPYFKQLQAFIQSEVAAQKHIFPPREKVFSAFNLCPYDNVKVVIIGQDPYHGPSQAHGLAFSVLPGVPPPPSLKNIFQELSNDLGYAPPSHGNLESWTKQGVLLLNVCLTVRKGEANSHNKKGWETFTDQVVKELSKKEGIVYLLWGKPALEKCKGINASKNYIITSSHPSPLGAYKTDKPFMGSKCFSKCNAKLKEWGKEEINWQLR